MTRRLSVSLTRSEILSGARLQSTIMRVSARQRPRQTNPYVASGRAPVDYPVFALLGMDLRQDRDNDR